MRRAARAFALALIVAATPASAQTPAPTAPKEITRIELVTAGVRLEEQLRKAHAGLVQNRAPAQLRRLAETQRGRDVRVALATAGAAVVAGPKESASWLLYAHLALDLDPKDSRERYELHENATIAAYQAYRRTTVKGEEAAALGVLGTSYERRQMWRPALEAYRASLRLADNADIRASYEDIRAQHGFRILDYTVDSDSAAPRLCVQFSEALVQRDLTPFVAVAGMPNPALTVTGQELCIDGLKHGERYAVTLRQGLPSSVGESLLKAASYDIYVRDRAPQLRFTGRNYILPRTGQAGIPIVGVNTPRAAVTIARIGDRNLLSSVKNGNFLAQLDSYELEQIRDERGTEVWKGTIDLGSELNKDVVTAFPITEAVGRLDPGVYVMTAKPDSQARTDEQDYEPVATQWFVVSDLGLTAFSGEDGVSVLVRSLASAAPLAGVEVRLVARNNEILATAATDARGLARFDQSRGKGGTVPALAIAAAGGDYGFLDLDQGALDLTDRGVKGREPPGALDAFVYAERGVYRSGESVHLTTLLRDGKGLAVRGVPLTLVVQRPDGVEYRRVQVDDQGQGGRALTVPILSGAPYGTWRVAAHADPKGPAIGETTFLVEDYLPERLEVTLQPKDKALKPGQPAEIAVDVRYLYGAPGADLAITGEVVVEAAPAGGLPGLEGFAVGLEDQAFEAVTSELEEEIKTDARGKASVLVDLPETEATRRPLQARITLRAAEDGGRAVARSVTLPLLPPGPVLGVKKLFEDLGENAPATFEVVAADAEGRRTARRGVTWSLYRLDTRWQWYRADGRWEYEKVQSSRRVADGRLDVAADAPARISAAVGGWGRYRLDVRGEGPDATQTSVGFAVGWAGADASAETPDFLPLTLDKASYRAGETMTVKLDPRFTGKATIAVIGDRISELRTIDVERAGTTITLPVSREWGAGAYVVGAAYRPMDQGARLMPGRALGVAWFAIDRDARQLPVALDVPQTMRPRGTLSIPVKLAGLAAGESAFVTVAAVDVGILNLTRYQTPDAAAHFFGQRRLAVDVRDLYGFLIDGMNAQRGAIRSGGDEAPAELEGSPPREAPLARYSGVVQVGPDGTARVDFDIPAFNGTVRVMAVAWSGDRVGQASADVVVRDPVVLTATLPRFLAIGDASRLHVAFDNVEGPGGTYTATIEPKGPVTVAADARRRQFQLATRGRGELVVPITATAMGTATFDLRLTGPQVDIAQSYVVNVQPGTSAVVRRRVLPLEAGQTLQVSGDLLADILPGTGAVSLAATPLAALDVAALLKSLDRYPYGCSEQIVSRALPLLYVNRLAQIEALSLDGEIDGRIRDAIERVLARQDASGTFGLWSVGGSDVWLDAFVTDFLTRARERGFAVPKVAFDLALDRLRNYVGNKTDAEGEAADGFAYAIYVLARNGRPVMGDLRYVADLRLDKFGSALARAQIGAGLALLGDRGRATRAFDASYALLRQQKDERVSRLDYGSRLRDGAGLLALAAEAGATGDLVQRVGAVVEDSRNATRWTSTQENAWLVLAANGMAKAWEGLSLAVDGRAHKGAYFRTVPMAALEGGRTIAVTNTGATPIRLVVGVNGNPATPEPAASEGYAVERAYYKLDGSKVDPRQVRQNDRFVVVLTVTERDPKFARLLLVDRLPAGLEIDSPALVAGSDLKGLDWLKRDVEPAHSEYRDDRFVAAFDRAPRQPAVFSVAYVVRAVAPGRYAHPPALAEDMYRPERFGRTAFGQIEVVPVR